ncbi:metallophosphoesterase family protein [Pseudomonas atagonensis]|uniref:metallophosphoesterase family protein n=1 Tax=Pseudomonas atagonensis TaxID=2609964 RepID=UPI00140A966D|nr:metallophosphoesterase [Pseudomonas atagonensis]
MFNNKFSYFGSLFFSALAVFINTAQADYSPSRFVFASDPQFPWTEASDDGDKESSSDRDKRSRWLIETQYADIADFRRSVVLNPNNVPVMINGDMTAFGHGSERATVREILDKQLAGNYDYGLGNHDYENNVDDCFLNNCAAGSIVDFKERYFGKLPGLDMSYDSESTIKRRLSGSLAYSKDYGDVHVVQLNNEPTYSTQFTAYDWGVPTLYAITDSLDWLEKDLKAARVKGQIILLNMHKPDDWKGSAEQITRFKEMIERYKVTAVFAGHYHQRVGNYSKRSVERVFGSVPVYLSGGASNQSYLTISIAGDRKSMKVYQVSANDWRKTLEEIDTIEIR